MDINILKKESHVLYNIQDDLYVDSYVVQVHTDAVKSPNMKSKDMYVTIKYIDSEGAWKTRQTIPARLFIFQSIASALEDCGIQQS